MNQIAGKVLTWVLVRVVERRDAGMVKNAARNVTSDRKCLATAGLGSLELVWLLERLTRLEVSNNCLTSTTGIDRLPNLTWLDLSFNQVS